MNWSNVKAKIPPPISIVVGFLLSTVLLSLIDYNLNASIVSVTDRLLFSAVGEAKFCLRVAFIFWLSFRFGKKLSISWIAGLSLFICWVAFSEMTNPQFPSFDLYQHWGNLYRILLFFLVFHLLHKGLALSIQPKGQKESVRRLGMFTMLWSTAMFFTLFLCDSTIRRWAIEQDASNMQSDPPLLALVASVTRSTLWGGCAMLLATPNRWNFRIGISMVIAWVVTRSCVILYLIKVLYPSLEDMRFRWNNFLTWEELAILQSVQLACVSVAMFLILRSGYHFHVGFHESQQPTVKPISFDDMH